MELDKDSSSQQRIDSVPAPAGPTFGALITIPDPGYDPGMLPVFLSAVQGSRKLEEKKS